MKAQLYFTVCLLVLLGLIGCGEPAKPIPAKPLFGKAETAAIFESIRPPSQIYQVQAEKDQVVSGKDGTSVFVPQNAFVDASGKPVEGEIQIELVEAVKKSDFIRANLQTISDGQPLISEGMLYINATANGQPLQLAEGKTLQIDLPQVGAGEEPASLFSGSFDADGNLNWTQMGEMENRMIPLPLEMFVFEDPMFYPPVEVVEGKYSYGLDSLLFKNSRFQNTFVSTRAFQRRYFAMRLADQQINRARWFMEGPFAIEEMVHPITDIYLDGLHDDLWKADSLAWKYLQSNAPAMLGGEDSTVYTPNANPFLQFYQKGLTKVVPVNYQGVNLESEQAAEQLVQSGVNQELIGQIMIEYEKQKTLREAMLNEAKKRKQEQAFRQLQTNCFSITQLGWINCDRFYDDPQAVPVELFVTVDGIHESGATNVSLIFQGRNLVLNGNKLPDGRFSMTRESEFYTTRLPIGEKVTLLALGMNDGTSYLAQKEMVLTEKGEVQLSLEPHSQAEIQGIIGKM
ncbi:MAG: hypothetical protein AAF206_01325 [Bacteroidota bacterium]